MQQFVIRSGKLNVKFVFVMDVFCVQCAGWNKMVERHAYKYVPLVVACGKSVL